MHKRAHWIVAAVIVASCGGKQPPVATPPNAEPPSTPIEPAPAAVAQPAPPKARAVVAPKLVAKPLPGDSMRTTIHRLSNGMTVYISPDKQVPSVTAFVAVHAGGSYDPKESTGLAHYLEHMLFKGTSRLGTQDFTQEKPHLDKIAALYDELRTPTADRARVLRDIDAETQAAAAFAIPSELDQLRRR
jgi:hypothetical protein